jgi:hypothetical protein
MASAESQCTLVQVRTRAKFRSSHILRFPRGSQTCCDLGKDDVVRRLRGNKKQCTATLDITQRLEDGSQKWVLANRLEVMRLALQIQ